MSAILETIVNHLAWTGDQLLLHGVCGTDRPLIVAPTTAHQPVTIAKISEFLYAHFYAGDPRLFEAQAKEMLFNLLRRVADPPFFARIRAANPGAGYSSSGWEVTGQRDGDGIFVQKQGITLLVQPGRHISEVDPAAGVALVVRFPAEALYAMPGFYLLFGDAGPANSASCTRFYLNLLPESAPSIIHMLLTALLAQGIAYTLKVVNDPSFFVRRDNTVLYVKQESYVAAARCVLRVVRALPEALRDETPSLTFRLAPGVGVADNPVRMNDLEAGQANSSFGMHRMQLLANGIGEAVAVGSATRSTVLAAMQASFVKAGIDPARAYLYAKESFDRYQHSIDTGELE